LVGSGVIYSDLDFDSYPELDSDTDPDPQQCYGTEHCEVYIAIGTSSGLSSIKYKDKICRPCETKS